MKSIAILAMSALSAFAGSEVKYQAGDVTAHGYLALPEGASTENKVPGVVVIHEWWGHNDYARKRADMVAELGYAALAIDMYGKGKTTTHPKDAGSFAKEATSNNEVMKERFLAGMNFLQAQEQVDESKTIAMGYCMGGRIALQMAVMNTPNLLGAASFHGALNVEVPEEVTIIKPKLLVCNGADDTFISQETIAEFKKAIVEHKGEMVFINFPDAVHGFTNPKATELGKKNNLNLAYNEEADEESWATFVDFAARVFAGEDIEPQ
ncbi:MAG: dienelactone hydrolase family protein [Verrucomicrobiota bacterium JB023]|nr:dienelactone hydrolase family protein [Verrucomicrobiota bacterium JB023]